MLERPLHLLDVVSAASDIDVLILWVLNAQSVPATLVMTFPSTMALLEVVPALTDRQADVLIIELCAVQFQEVDKMFTEVNIVGSAPLVLPLEIAGNHHC